MAVLFGYIVEYALQRKIEVSVLKKGSKYFNVKVGSIIFVDILNFTAPCSLEKYLSQWYEGEVKKSVFPYQHFSTIEEIRNQIEFPSHEAFYSDLKQKNLPIEEYEKAKREYDYRRSLPATNSDHIRNFSDWLRHYQLIDVVPLTEAIQNSFYTYYRHFGTDPMLFRSLPGLAFETAFSLFADNMPYVCTFTPSFDYVREIFRDNQYGGLVNLYHRQIILNDNVEGPRNAKIAPNGDKFTYFS